MELALEIASYIFWILLALTLLVFVHEMGHFLAAKLFNMRVDRFSIGFPPKIFGKQIGETEYAIGATPLGGYVKIAGMIDESMDTDHLESEPDPWEFRAKPVWQRIIVITAGVIFNVVLAFFIFFGLKLAVGETYYPAENVQSVYVADSSLAYQMGLRTGDNILAVNGEPVQRYQNLTVINLFGTSNITMDRMNVTVERAGERITLQAPGDLLEQLSEARIFGISALPPLVGSVVGGSPADSLGLSSGDRIVSINGRRVRYWAQLTPALQAGTGPVRVQWQRSAALAEAAQGTGSDEARDAVDQATGSDEARAALDQGIREEQEVLYQDPTSGAGRMYEGSFVPQDTTEGIMLGVSAVTDGPLLAELYGQRHDRYGVGEAVVGGVEETWQFTTAFVMSLGRLFTGQDDLTKSVGGPVMIAKMTKNAAEAGAQYFWRFVAILSITLAIINILPIPALDGGHLMFLLYEGILRRKPSMKVRMAMQQAGMLLLLAFMVFVIFNDIVRL